MSARTTGYSLSTLIWQVHQYALADIASMGLSVVARWFPWGNFIPSSFLFARPTSSGPWCILMKTMPLVDHTSSGRNGSSERRSSTSCVPLANRFRNRVLTHVG